MSIVSEIYWRELDNLPDALAIEELRSRQGPEWWSFHRDRTIEADLRIVVADQLRYIRILEEQVRGDLLAPASKMKR